MQYVPDRWIIVEISGKNFGPDKRVLCGWSGGYTSGDSWRLGSKIVSYEEVDESYIFTTRSGKEYICRKSGHGLSVIMAGILQSIEAVEEVVVEQLDPAKAIDELLR